MMSLAGAGRRPAGHETLILLVAVAAFVAAVAPALRETGTAPGWDQSVHLRDSLVYERILRHPSVLAGGVLGAILHGSEDFPLLTPSGYYPPLVPGITALLYCVAGRSYETAMATQILFLVVLVFGTWALGNRLLGAPVGLAAGLMLLAAPGIRLNAEEYMLDLPLTAMVAVSAWALLVSDGFVRRDRSLLFGVLAGAGMLTKWTFFLFLALPVALVLASGLAATSKESVPRSRRWNNFALGVLVLLAVTGLADRWRTEDRGDWNIRPLVARLEQELARRSNLPHKVPMLGVIPDIREVNGPTIAYYAARRDLPVTVVQLVNRMKRRVAVEVGLDPFGRDDFYQSFDQYDFLATKDGDNAVPPWEDVVPRMQAYFEERLSEFELLASFREPDGSTLALYGRKRG